MDQVASKPAMQAERAMQIQMEAAKRLMQNLRDQGVDDDAELVADTIEGQTNLPEAMDACLSQIDEAEVLIIGLKEKIKSFEARQKQIENFVERVRALMEQAMIIADQPSMKLATATVSLTRRAAQAVIINEADIPAKFWIAPPRPDPKLDKKALLEALRANEVVTGAELDNGSLSLSVRRK